MSTNDDGLRQWPWITVMTDIATGLPIAHRSRYWDGRRWAVTDWTWMSGAQETTAIDDGSSSDVEAVKKWLRRPGLALAPEPTEAMRRSGLKRPHRSLFERLERARYRHDQGSSPSDRYVRAQQDRAAIRPCDEDA